MDDVKEYKIGESYTLRMRKGDRGYAGHYDDHSSGRRHTFDAPGMSKKQILKKLWKRAKDKEVQQ